MNIYSDKEFRTYDGTNLELKQLNNLFKKLFDSGNLVYMKSVNHFGKKVPVSMIKFNFRSLIHLSEQLFRNDPEDTMVDLGYEPSVRWIIKTVLSLEGVRNVKFTGGAYSKVTMSSIDFGFFGEESEIKRDGKDVGYLIVVDSNLEDYGVNLDAIIHHEYFHCKKEGGCTEEEINYVLEAPMNEIMNPQNKYYLDPEEERECDAFAEKETGHRINCMKIFTRYLPSHGMGKVGCAISGMITLLKERRHF